jgi:outer membrane protein OmpA-like peptidoglycan-associated protein
MGMCVERQGRSVGAGGQAASLMGRGVACALLLALGGCGGVDSVERFYSSKLPFDTPIDWWHQLEGGVIADERPPPPGVGDPYPNLAEVPAKPTPTDAATRRALSARLATDRDRTTRSAAQDPMQPRPGADAAAPAAAAAAPAPAPAAPAAAAPMVARIEAATAPPAPAPAPEAPAPAAPAALQAAASPSAPPRRPSTDAPPAAPVVSGPVPALPAGPPPIPDLPGIPATTTAPATPKPRPQVAATFLPESSVLRPVSADALRALAARRAGGTIAVLGGGDATSAAPDAQARALPLAWRRAQAMAVVLTAAGVPASAMRIDAAALARGGIARLID